MPFQPMPVKIYKQYIKTAGWSLVKAGIDWKLLNEKGQMLSTIIIAHGKNTNEQVIAFSVQKTEKLFKSKGKQWPPKKR